MTKKDLPPSALLDVNLLQLFELIYSSRSVTRAARRTGVTQPTMKPTEVMANSGNRMATMRSSMGGGEVDDEATPPGPEPAASRESLLELGGHEKQKRAARPPSIASQTAPPYST